MTKLHSIAGPEEPDGDVIFVHGLGGDHFSTWQHDESRPDDSWPNWLASALSNVAVHGLEYEASPTHWLGEAMPLQDRALNVLNELEARDIGSRMLTFIGHSLGGLVIKELLREASSKEEGSAWRRIHDRTRLVVFLATPHMGADMASWAARLGQVFRVSPALSGLAAHDAHLRSLDRWYRDHHRCWDTLAYYETRPTNIVSLLGISRWQTVVNRLPTRLIVVDQGDADPKVSGCTPIPLEQDHITISKPANGDAALCINVARRITQAFEEGRGMKEEPSSETVDEPAVQARASGSGDQDRNDVEGDSSRQQALEINRGGDAKACRLVLAYAGGDLPAVRTLYRDLKRDGFDPWMETEDLVPGRVAKTEVPKQIRDAAVVLPCLSSKSVGSSGGLHQHIRLALNKLAETPPDTIAVIPVRLDPCELPEHVLTELGISFKDIQQADLFEGGGYDKLVAALKLAGKATTEHAVDETSVGDTSREKLCARLDEIETEVLSYYRDQIVFRLMEAPTALDELSISSAAASSDQKARAEALATQLLQMSVKDVQIVLDRAHQRLRQKRRVQAATVCYDIAGLVLPAVYNPSTIAQARHQIKSAGTYVVRLGVRLELVADIILAAVTGRELRVRPPDEDYQFPKDAEFRLDLPPNIGRGGQTAYIAAWDDYLWNKFGNDSREPNDRVKWVDEELEHLALTRYPPEIHYVVLPEDEEQRGLLELSVKKLREKYRHLLIVGLAQDGGLDTEDGQFRSYRDMARREGTQG